MTNYERFEHAVRLVLLQLYEAFPLPIEIDPNSLDPAFKWDYSTEQAKPLWIHAATIEFLGREGFVTFSPREGSSRIFRECILTSKGLTALNAMPKQLSGQQTIIDSLKSVGSNATDTGVKAVVSESIKRFIGMYVGT